ncbi:MAG: glycosyltransferase family 2 protein [Desulfobacterales bacterium]|nr:glycosyltransferase family 2 protein [Desulfobacterales bacterium]
MYCGKKVCVVVPAYNEEKQIPKVLNAMPDFIDQIVVIDDASRDRTCEIVKQYQQHQHHLILIEHYINKGVGGSIASGYKWARDHDYDIAVVMAGDGQMDPKELPDLLDAVVEDRADFSKGNRLFSGEAYKKIPKIRYFGNAFLSLMTKIASGYWHVADAQSGYTVVNKRILHTMDWDKMYKRYGQPNDLLVRLNIFNFRIADIPIEPVYNIGEKSGIHIPTVIFTISFLLIKLFFWRLKEKYIIRDFHPLILFYMLGAVCFPIGLIGGLYLLWLRIITTSSIQPTAPLFFAFFFLIGIQSLFFAMWFDMEYNRDLKDGYPHKRLK